MGFKPVVDAANTLTNWTEQRGERQGLSESSLKEVFGSLASYLKMLSREKLLREEATCLGVQALVALSLEAAARIEKEQGRGTVTHLQEFRDLEQIYRQKVLPSLPKKAAALKYQKWQESSSGVLDTVEDVRSDRDYELFWLSKEEGESYVNPSLKAHIDLLGQFQNVFLSISTENLYKQIDVVSDHAIWQRARSILQAQAPLIDAFYAQALKFKQVPFIQELGKAVMALMLSGNARNQLSQTEGKSCQAYFRDFHYYLRSALVLSQKKKVSSESFWQTADQLLSALCSSLFLTAMPSSEMISFLRSLIQQGLEKRAQKQDVFAGLCDEVLSDDKALRLSLLGYPSGPLCKAFELFDQRQWITGLDLLLQTSPLKPLYTLQSQEIDSTLLSLPSPTMQTSINQAQIVPEMQAFLEGLKAKGQHHLLINLQDRSSWKESSRSECLEGSGESQVLTVITLDRSSAFYQQNEAYEHLSGAEEFIRCFKEHLSSESSGFYFPQDIRGSDWQQFISSALVATHRAFFSSKEHLDRHERCSFIEIFYILLTLKMIEWVKADTFSFTDKDGVDDASCMSAELFAFIKLLRADFSQEDKDHLLWLLHSSALFLRERSLSASCFDRVVGSLRIVEEALKKNQSSALQMCHSLYHTHFFSGLSITKS